ncbi:fumarylacetoacetate hydrolase family protein [Limisalsivibrio acetivorans]|uniref:fumarylacetoacetate hydrolase family protein n=1 Tax=Limisalsivibrio acetivorans TaxID=1304888 RepID=UPI0003B5B6CB|nr:fumarylacetoacetate hydrolase family protein [Limisalsivibrio acetivorans]
MKLLRFRDGKVEKKGAVVDGKVRRVQGSFFEEYVITEEEHSLDDIEFLPPVLPSKVVCVARNYAAHAKELGNEVPETPLIFLKPSTAVNSHEGVVEYPPSSSQVDYEGELGVVIGKHCKNVKPEKAEEFIFGYTALNDFTARDIQKEEGKFTRAKSFDTFAPFGPFIETDMDWRSKRVQTRVNGETKQDGTTEQMIFDIPTLISFISEIMTLLPGDVIATGTPPGVGAVQDGDVVEVEVEGIGVLRNHVRKG